MDDLVVFMEARLDEDEHAARAVLGTNVLALLKRGKAAPRWVPSPEGDAAIRDTDGILRVKFVWALERDHIIRHDPARVLRGVAAKRAALNEYVYLYERALKPGLYPQPDEAGRFEVAAMLTRALAAEWDDHPDYREEWRLGTPTGEAG